MNDFLLNVTKFFLAILLLPIVIASAVTFKAHLRYYPGGIDEYILIGLLGFLIVFLFIYQFWGVYEFGQKMMSGAFSFIAPFNRVAAYFLPFYFICVVLLFFISRKFLDWHHLDPYFIIFSGSALGMHILLTAQDLQINENTPIKSKYLLTMTLAFIINLFLAIILFDLVYERLSLNLYFNELVATSKKFYAVSFKKILLLD